VQAPDAVTFKASRNAFVGGLIIFNKFVLLTVQNLWKYRSKCEKNQSLLELFKCFVRIVPSVHIPFNV